MGGAVHSLARTDGIAAIEAKTTRPIPPAHTVGGNLTAPKIVNDPEKSEKTSVGGTLVDTGSTGDSRVNLSGPYSIASPALDVLPTESTRKDIKTASANLAASAQSPHALPSYNPSFLSRANPWSTYRKLSKVDQGRLDAEPDAQGCLRYYDSSLVIALWNTTWKQLVLAILFKAGQSTLETTSSLVTKQLIAFITTNHAWDKLGEADRSAGAVKPPLSIGHGIALAIGLAVMQEVASLLGNHYYLQSFGCGMFSRLFIDRLRYCLT